MLDIWKLDILYTNTQNIWKLDILYIPMRKTSDSQIYQSVRHLNGQLYQYVKYLKVKYANK